MIPILIIIYLFLYISHIILGPYYYRFYLKNQKIKYKSKNYYEILKKCLYITYVSLLYTIYFLIYPNSESFVLALLMTILSFFTYIFIFPNSPHFKISLIDHSILLLPFLYFYFKFNIKISHFKATNQSFFTFYLILFYVYYYKQIYDIKN